MAKTSEIRLLQHKHVQPDKMIMALAGLKYSNLSPKVPKRYKYLCRKIIFSVANCLTSISTSEVRFPAMYLGLPAGLIWCKTPLISSLI